MKTIRKKRKNFILTHTPRSLKTSFWTNSTSITFKLELRASHETESVLNVELGSLIKLPAC